MTFSDKTSAKALIDNNIAKHGHHIYVVGGGNIPRFAYTIGLHGRIGSELILAGASFFTSNDVIQIVSSIANLMIHESLPAKQPIEIDHLGGFSLDGVDPTWVSSLLLGALDYFDLTMVSALQIRPDFAHTTIDVPNLAKPWNSAEEPVWRWLKESWNFAIPEKSTAVTNLAALRGAKITEVMRWEVDQWDMFAGAGPDTPKEDARVIPISTLLAVDPSLKSVIPLEVGKGLWRKSSEFEWHDWNSR